MLIKVTTCSTTTTTTKKKTGNEKTQMIFKKIECGT